MRSIGVCLGKPALEGVGSIVLARRMRWYHGEKRQRTKDTGGCWRDKNRNADYRGN